ncbi:hypothetical protein MNBD_GAMMA06-1538 [hydrothermal vent metagenome]|uniref:Fungal lipase-type domain-containing protein n=1 Tax=hydrothermal vent metagenome TaxID=652676 RepID=A0A3B0WMG2_9ZZZZ
MIFRTFLNLLILTLAFVLLFSNTSLHAAPVSREKATTQQFNSKNFSHWLNAAYIADATYKTKNDLQSIFSTQNYKLKQFKQLGSYAIAYALATNDKTKQHIIAIRGTSNAENVIADIAFELVADKQTGIDIHQGFLLSSRDIYNNVLPELKPEYKITTIGHSLGGAAALILAMTLDAKGYSINEVITFGQPKVTNISGSRKFSHLNIKRLVTEKDVVPLSPPFDPMDLANLSIFWHQGTEIVLFKNNQYAVLTGTDSMMRASDFLNDTPDKQHLESHFMTTYIRYLKSKLNSPEQVVFKSDFKFSDWFGSSSK